MDEDDNMQQFSLRWHNHQSSVVGALGRMLITGALADVTLSVCGATIKAHRLVLASCSQYFAQLFKEVESETGSLVVVLGCDAVELRLLLTFMYTGEVTASRTSLPALLKLAQMLKVSGLTHAEANSPPPSATQEEYKNELTENLLLHSPIALDLKKEYNDDISNLTAINDNRFNTVDNERLHFETATMPGVETSQPYIDSTPMMTDLMIRNEKDRLSKLDQIVKNLYNTHKIVNPTSSIPGTPIMNSSGGAQCSVCHKRLSNQYNLRVHLETHAGARHRCRHCAHVSRSRDALRKHVAYRHPPSHSHTQQTQAASKLQQII